MKHTLDQKLEPKEKGKVIGPQKPKSKPKKREPNVL